MNAKQEPEDLSIIIPAYFESENLQILLAKICAEFPKAFICIVDDSDFKERKKLERLAQTLKNNRLNFIFRYVKSGRGSAVIDGLTYMLKTYNTYYYVEMDADLAHDVRDIKKMQLKARDADLVIGSRYLPGSRITDWPVRRLIQSRIINAGLNLWLGLNISDYTNGLRLYRRQAVRYLVSIRLREKGFIALSEIAYKLSKQGFTLTEVAVTFTDRKFGQSNANFSELLASLVGAIRIRLRS
ncbi:hypothetical protein A2154_00135 [Candidatus Gottesmanbacteria bacterium RBG_16_43_7]|uniref:Glycosyltransferase 2-like domain-containing protein n=1 Tax=Candidatus Gottesmanbacteria bacterium RBG_16_43_7 TaxID=1798373 RepID=A0A1F5ZCD5_9BACT|nr:MAG: hypothetical protein A2154_00135 [Candidatus Gottesmanbacteria bacterium RBG_16_43_7]